MSDSEYSYGSPFDVIEKQNDAKKAGYSSLARDMARLDINVNAAPIPVHFGPPPTVPDGFFDEEDFFCISFADFFPSGTSQEESTPPSIHTADKQTYDSVYGNEYFDAQEESLTAADNPDLVEGQISNFANLVCKMRAERLYDITLSDDHPKPEDEFLTPQSATISPIDDLHDNIVSRSLLQQEKLAPGFHGKPPHDTVKQLFSAVTSSDFQTAKDSYIRSIKSNHHETSYAQCFADLSDSEMGQLFRVLSYSETDHDIPRYIAADIKYVYLPSGGGKTTLTQQATELVDRLYDVDEFIRQHYEQFDLFCRLRDKYGWRDLFSQWFKYAVHNYADKLRGKIFLCNHPNQIPNYMRLGYNELVLIPAEWQFGLRWFDENIMSLLGIIGKRKVIGRYDSYEEIIKHRFPLGRALSFKV